MAFISHEVAEISSKVAEWKDIANKVNELSKNFFFIKQVPKHHVLHWPSFTLLFLDPYAGFGSWFFFPHKRKINKHVWSVKQKVFENNTLEQCLNLQENGEEEIQHWLLLLSNSFRSRCAGDSGGVCQHTMQARKPCSTVTFLRNQEPGAQCFLSHNFLRSIFEILRSYCQV